MVHLHVSAPPRPTPFRAMYQHLIHVHACVLVCPGCTNKLNIRHRTHVIPTKDRPEARRIKAEKAGVPLEDFEEPRRESLTEVEQRARQFVDALVADADGDTFMQREAADARGRETEGRATDGSGTEKEEGGGADGCCERLALVVSHGGLLNVMMSVVMGLEEVGFMGNCSVAVVEVFEKEEGGFSFVSGVLNDDSHVEAAGLSADGAGVENFEK